VPSLHKLITQQMTVIMSTQLTSASVERPRVAIVDYWPDVENAETECILRLTSALDSLGIDTVVINRHGFLVDDDSTHIDEMSVRFVIALHFDSAKCWGSFTYCALWNPLDFYFQWSYRDKTNNMLSHDNFLSCGSQVADDHIRRALMGVRRDVATEFPTLFHAVHEPVLTPSAGRGKLFYCGINWEAISGNGGRHQELLKTLDREGLVDIYGPHVFQGVEVWRGYDAYRGSIPFDGKSLITKVAESGIGLVLSSKAHINSALMSSRLFEALAAGVPIICDENGFAQKYLGETLLYVDSTASAPVLAEQIKRHVTWIKAHPDEAIQLATAAQKIYLEKLSLTQNLERLLKPSGSDAPMSLKRPVSAFYSAFIALDVDHKLLRKIRAFGKSFLHADNFHLIVAVPDNVSSVRVEEIKSAFPGTHILRFGPRSKDAEQLSTAALRCISTFLASVDSTATIQIVPPWEDPLGPATLEMWQFLDANPSYTSIIAGFTTKKNCNNPAQGSAQFFLAPAHPRIFDVTCEFSLACILFNARWVFQQLSSTLTYAPNLFGRAIYLSCLRDGRFKKLAKPAAVVDHDEYVRKFRTSQAESVAREAEIIVDAVGREFFLQTSGGRQDDLSPLGGAPLAPEQFIGLLKVESSRLLLVKLFDAMALPTFVSKPIKWMWRKIAL
jgi:hypothetical protein